VNLIKSGKEYEFQLGVREKDLLRHVLSLYPRIPSGHQRLSKSYTQESNQQLLEDALAETRAHNRKSLESFLQDGRNFKKGEQGWRLKLTPEDLEWLLQVLNDVRIGSWIRLGSPESPARGLKAESAPDFWAMEMAGAFQMAFLEVLDH